MDARHVCVVALLVLPAAASAQTGYSITGGLSNFDCGNRCDEACDEFEVEIEDCRPEDVIHTYANANYGAPSVTLSMSPTIRSGRMPSPIRASAPPSTPISTGRTSRR